MTYPHPETEDLWEEATKKPPSYFFGRIETAVRRCTMVYDGDKWGLQEYDQVLFEKTKTQPRKAKGAAREAGDAFNTYQATFTLAPLDPSSGFITRECSPSNPRDKEWPIIKASLEALAPRIAEAKGLVVGQFRTEAAISGMYVSGKYTLQVGEDRYTTFEFTDVYTCEDECRAAYTQRVAEEAEEVPTPGAPAQELVGGDVAHRAQMAAFLPHLWEQAKVTPTPLAEMDRLIKANTMLAMFNLESAEVVALTGIADPAGGLELEKIPF